MGSSAAAQRCVRYAIARGDATAAAAVHAGDAKLLAPGAERRARRAAAGNYLVIPETASRRFPEVGRRHLQLGHTDTHGQRSVRKEEQ